MIVNFKLYTAVSSFSMVEGRKLIIKTAHKPLMYAFLQKSRKASPRQLRQLDLIDNLPRKSFM